ncbi:MAG: class II aldolase/adducin family protein [Saccharofermentanales bacterium]
MDYSLLHPADQLVMIIDRIYHHGMTTTSGGNLSIQDDNGDIWITPSGIDSGIDKGNLTRDDMICVKPDGTKIGKHDPSGELLFHQLIYKKRFDIKAILHAHPASLVAFGIVHTLPEVHLIPNIKLMCGEISITPYGIPGSDELSERIANEFDKGFSSVLLENHGVVMGSATLFKAFKAFETLEFCAQMQIHALKLGAVKPLVPRDIDFSKLKSNAALDEFTPAIHTSEERAARRDLILLIRRSYDQLLFTSTQGTYSVRLSDGSVIITPFGKDRKYLIEEDLVLINKGQRESGKFPNRSVNLHLSIYEKNPSVNSILVAHPPYLMAFAVTDAQFDTSILLESYSMLREVKKIPYGSNFLDMEATASMISDKTPMLICSNDCVLVTGGNLTKAFDRLKVADYCARSIISSVGIGKLIPISQVELEKIDHSFG